MNLYFLSLLRKDIKRKKNIANKYFVGSEYKYQEERQTNFYLKTRFPFLEKGDEVGIFDFIPIWDGNSLFSCFIPENSHPLFYVYSKNRNKVSLSRLDIERLSSCLEEVENKLKASRFKIGKTKYDIYFYGLPREYWGCSNVCLAWPEPDVVIDEVSLHFKKVLYLY
jgi:hypothetical protein